MDGFHTDSPCWRKTARWCCADLPRAYVLMAPVRLPNIVFFSYLVALLLRLEQELEVWGKLR